MARGLYPSIPGGRRADGSHRLIRHTHQRKQLWRL